MIKKKSLIYIFIKKNLSLFIFLCNSYISKTFSQKHKILEKCGFIQSIEIKIKMYLYSSN